LFDLASFDKKITGDLFSEDSFFTDANTFWEAQDAAIAERRDQYLAAKWAEVVVLERGAQWPQWDFVKATKKDGGRVYIEPTRTGEVRFHEGYVTARELREAEKKESRAKAKAKAIITVSGLVNSVFLIGINPVQAFSTHYGRILALKLAVFVIMLGLAATNRFRHVPALGHALADGASPVKLDRLRFSICIETVAAALILALVSWLGTLQPPTAQ
jgi:ParB family chromosome partitioning protein